jgi:hypothetical protein
MRTTNEFKLLSLVQLVPKLRRHGVSKHKLYAWAKEPGFPLIDGQTTVQAVLQWAEQRIQNKLKEQAA